MLKLRQLKAQQDAAKKKQAEAGGTSAPTVSAAELVVQKEVGKLHEVESSGIKVDFPNPDNLMSSTVTVCPGACPASSGHCSSKLRRSLI